ncbi:hypothetical protein Tsubulata_028207 [Turnera subulata]|uniref:Uncharacterized protein n=1 Tax=Turnera subulata TaxID=218843 RepID=A0A9Q0J9D0_9ROSI|nr:hypothetical protein Tsubulata_028207 [Turnera subulata]
MEAPISTSRFLLLGLIFAICGTIKVESGLPGDQPSPQKEPLKPPPLAAVKHQSTAPPPPPRSPALPGGKTPPPPPRSRRPPPSPAGLLHSPPAQIGKSPPKKETSAHQPSHMPAEHEKSKMNNGKKIGLLFVGFALILQIGVVGFLIFKRSQLLKVTDRYENFSS